MRGFRVFSSRLDARERLLYGIVTLVFVGTFFALQWPIYNWFSTIEPVVLGMPFSLVYIILLLLLCFGSLLALFVWEDRRGKHDEDTVSPTAVPPVSAPPPAAHGD